jgi:hypothetical protein
MAKREAITYYCTMEFDTVSVLACHKSMSLLVPGLKLQYRAYISMLVTACRTWQGLTSSARVLIGQGSVMD